MNRELTIAIYSPSSEPAERPSTPHPRQTKHRHGFKQPRNAYDPTAPDLLRVAIR